MTEKPTPALRLYLSSYRLGRNADVMRWPGPGVGRAAVVLNALDGYGATRRITLRREVSDLRSLGYRARELDLRTFFDAPDLLGAALAEIDLLWVVGGNSFVLARAAAAAGLASALDDRGRQKQGFWYAGYSAGACLAGPDLVGIELMDDDSVIPEGYPPIPPTTLRLIDERIVAHWRSDHRESAAAEQAAEFLTQRGLAHRTLRDGEEYIVQ